MSRLDNPLSEIQSGTHLVVILSASLLRDAQNLPVVSKDGSNGVNIRFSDNTKNTDKLFWTKSSDFRKLCKAVNCDLKQPPLPQLRGKSLWMCVKEVKTMQGEECIKSEYVPFDYLECTHPEHKPIISGDPCQHPKGFPLGVFVEYLQSEIIAGEEFIGKYGEVISFETTNEQIGKLGLEMMDIVAEGKGLTSPEIKEKLAIGRKIIAEGEGKKMTSLNEKNDKKISDEAESHGESNDNNHVEDDWSNL